MTAPDPTPREVLAAAMYHPTSVDTSLADEALAALSAAGFEVLPRALVDAVLDPEQLVTFTLDAMEDLRRYRAAASS